MNSIETDIIVIGAGIAGTSAAAELATNANVIVLEREAHPGYHSTGRSAATWAPFYGPDVIQKLTALSKTTLCNPPIEMGGTAFTGPRGEMMLGRTGDEEEIDQHIEYGMQALSKSDALQYVPLINESVTHFLYTDNMLSIDVDALHQSYIKKTKSLGSSIECNQEVVSVEYSTNKWIVATATTQYSAPIVVNAAGAWADQIAALAGAETIGLQPKRRSAALTPYAEHSNMADWPMIFGAGEVFYCTPFGNGMMISPADETIVEPHDAWPDDLDIATGIDIFQQFINYEVQTLNHQWAGLRTFAPDGNPVVGFDSELPGFFWLAGQGGYGIQTSPAIGALCAELILTKHSVANTSVLLNESHRKDLTNALSPVRFFT